RAGLFGGDAGHDAGQAPAGRLARALALLCRDRQAGRCADPLQDLDQRAFERLMAIPDPVALTQALVRCPSVTPAAEAALDVAEQALGAMGFACRRLRFEEEGTAPVDNLFASIGEGAPHLVLAGHLDVVPPGDPARWTVDPFAGEI